MSFGKGRLRVYGGPGTGKTEIELSLAAGLFNQTKGREEILIIARNTDAAARMERRLFRLIGNNSITISTFRTLAAQVIPRPIEIISDFQIRLILTDLLRKLPPKSRLRKAAGSIQLTMELSGLLSLFRLNLISPQDLPEDDSDDLLNELKTLFLQLEERIADSGYITEPALLREGEKIHAGKYRAVLVEEAQDITPAEYFYLQSIAEASDLLVLFGDPYRNIHRFEGTNPDIMRYRLEQDFPAIETIHLKRSYRLGGSRIRLAANMFDRDAEPFIPSVGMGSDSIFYSEFASSTGEVATIASLIEELIRIRGLAPEEIAVVLRSPGITGHRFRRILAFKNIPFSGGSIPFLPPAVKELFSEIGDISSPEELTQDLPKIIRRLTLKRVNDEKSLRALSAAGKLMEETQSVMPEVPPVEIASIAKEEFQSRVFIRETGGVAITSIHAIPGKEYKVVFMPGLVENSFPAEVEQRFIFSSGWMEKLRRSVAKPISYIERADLDKHLNEERRLFYTAISLPTEELYLSRPLMSRGEELNPSLFLHETGLLSGEAGELAEPWPKIITGFLPAEESLEAETVRCLKKSDDKKSSGILKELEEEFSDRIEIKFISDRTAEDSAPAVKSPPIDHLSAGAINTYILCPRKFYYVYVLRLPTPVTPAMMTGKVLHKVLERLHRAGEQLNLKSAGESLENILREVIAAEDEIESGSALEKTLTLYLTRTINHYIESPEVHGGMVESLETGFAWEPQPGIKFIGRIDRIDRVGEGFELIDYKSRGDKKHQALKTRFTQVDHQEADLQLPIYFAAAEEALGLKVECMSLIPLEFKHDGPERIRFEITPAESKGEKLSRQTLGQIRDDVIELARKIVNSVEYGRGAHPKCRDPFSGMTCPYIHICELADL